MHNAKIALIGMLNFSVKLLCNCSSDGISPGIAGASVHFSLRKNLPDNPVCVFPNPVWSKAVFHDVLVKQLCIHSHNVSNNIRGLTSPQQLFTKEWKKMTMVIPLSFVGLEWQTSSSLEDMP